MASSAIAWTSLPVITLGWLNPMKTSAPSRASVTDPSCLRGLVIAARAVRSSSIRSRPGYSGPLESKMIMSWTPDSIKSRATATPAAPAPIMTTRMSAVFFRTRRSALCNAARTTTAVPC